METKFLSATDFPGLGGGYSLNGLIGSHNAVSIVMCVDLCLRNLACLGFFYNPRKMKCITNKVVFFKDDEYVKEEDWRYYRTTGEAKCMVKEDFIHNRQLEMCYMPREESKDFSDAKSACHSKNANLVKVDSSAKQDHLISTIHAMAINISTEVESSGSYSYLGCWLRPGGLSATFKKMSGAMTIEMCRDECKDDPYIELETQNMCYCVSSITDVSKKQPDSQCTQNCLGDSSQICGGGSSGRGPVYDIRAQPKASSVDFYIGLTKVASDWKWSDNQVAVYNSFDDSASGTCAVMTSQYNFRWKSVECTSKSGFICEI